MERSVISICKLCLFKSEPLDEICMEEANQMEQIINELFHHLITLTRLEIDEICMPCRVKLKSYHEYYKFVLENQQNYENQVKVALNTSSLTVELGIGKPEPGLEFVEIVKQEPLGDEDEKPFVKMEYEYTFVHENTKDLPMSTAKKRKTPLKKTQTKQKTVKLVKETIQKQEADEETEQIQKIFNFKCSKCADLKHFLSIEDLQTHALQAHGAPNTWTCCETEMTTREELLTHSRKHNRKNPLWKCKDCDLVFKNGWKLRSHLTKEHKNYCTICKQPKTPQETYFSHMQRHLLSKVPGQLARYVCDLCDKTTVDRRGLKRHMRVFHIGNKAEYICESCGASFIDKDCFTHHTRHVHGETPRIPCPVCGVLIKNRPNAMDYHIRRNHELKPMTCDICGKTLKNEMSLKMHKNRRHGVKKFSCSFCEKTFADKRRVKDHEAVHTGKPNYFCEFCTGASFKSLGNYSAHKRRVHPVEYQQQKDERMAKRFK